MAVAAASFTHSGMSAAMSVYPPATRAMKMTPMVFCASCRPWPRASRAEDTRCSILKRRITGWKEALRTRRITRVIIM